MTFAPKIVYIHNIIDVKIEEPSLCCVTISSPVTNAKYGSAWGHVARGTGTAWADCIHDNGNGGHDKEASLIRGAWYQSYNADKYDDILLRLSLYLHYIHHMEYDLLVWALLKLQTS